MAELLSAQDNLPDVALAERVRGGDNDAFSLLSERYKGLIASVASKYSAYGFDRNDFLQEGLLGLLWACRYYSPDRNSSFKNFAALCINRRYLSMVRKANTKRAIPSDRIVPIEELEISDHNSLNPETLFLEREQALDFEKRLNDALSPLELGVLRRYLSGMSYQDIALELDVSSKSVDNALQRIKKKLSTR